MVSIVLPPRDGGTDPVVEAPVSGGGVASEATFPRAVGPAGPGVAAGGTTGQVLAKLSGVDYATGWVDQSGGGGSSPPFPISDITGLQTSLDGKQPLDADLTAIAGLTGTNTLYYRSADSVWSPVIIGTNLNFVGGTLSATGGGVSPPFAISDTTGLQAALDGKQPLDGDLTAIAALTTTSFGRGQLTYADASAAKTALALVKGDVGLANVDNTSDAGKPVSTATQTALDLKAPIANPTFTGTVSGITATMVGLGNVTNTSDANKPVSTAQQTALNLKANLASPTFTGTVGGITAAMVGLGNVTNTSDANKPVSTAQQTALDLKANLASPTFTGTVSGISKAMVGLGNVDNTSDANKPVSTATQTALNLKANLASPTFTGTVTLPAGQIVNGVTLITGGSATTYLDATGAYSTPAGGGGGGSVAWGAITGTLSAQTDLQSALNAKANVAGQVFTGAISATNLSGTNTGDQTITLTGEATGSGTGSFAVTVSNDAVIAKVLTGYASSAGTISASDSILSAIQKLNGNDALKAPLASPTFTGTVTLPAGQVVNGVTLTTGGSSTTFLNGAGAYTTPAGGGGGSDPTDPSVGQSLVDDFITGNVETGEIGVLGWSFNNGSVTTTALVADHPGVFRRTSSATANSVDTFFSGNTGQVQVVRFGDVDEMTFIVSPTVTNTDFRVRMGLLSDMTANTPAGVYVERLATDTSWFGACIQTAPTVTRTAALGTFAAAWTKFKIRRISNTEWGFSMNGGTEVSITASTPTSTAGAVWGIQITPTTTTARILDIDFISMKTRAISR